MRPRRTSKHHNVWCAGVFLWIAMIEVIGLAPVPVFAQDLRDGPLITTIVGGNELLIPRRYFLPDPPPRKPPVDILLMALLPSLHPMREDNMAEFMATRGYGRIISIYARDSRQTTTLEFRLNVARKSGASYERRGDRFGLDVYVPMHFTANQNNIARQELFLGTEHGVLARSIECLVDGSVPFSGCHHNFVYRNLFFNLSYGKTQLPNWRKIEESVKRLLDQFGRIA
jgi:hypothetical protein